jgi:hypothetical protein
LSELKTYLERELKLSSRHDIRHDLHLLLRRGIEAELQPLLSKMVGQRMTSKLLKDPKSLANQPEVFVEMLDFVLKEDVKALEVGDYEFWSEIGVWC